MDINEFDSSLLDAVKKVMLDALSKADVDVPEEDINEKVEELISNMIDDIEIFVNDARLAELDGDNDNVSFTPSDAWKPEDDVVIEKESWQIDLEVEFK